MNLEIWKRRGSEGAAADREVETRYGLPAEPISHEDLESALAAHFATDLGDLSEEERAEALEALVAGYRRGA